MPRIARGARRRHGPVRRQHVVRRGAARERSRARARRRHRHASARRRRCSPTCRPELHVLLTHLHLDHLQGLGFFRPLFAPGLDDPDLGSDVAGAELWRSASRCTCRRRCSRCTSTTCRRTISFHDAPEFDGHDRLGDGARREGDPPGSDRRLPDRGARARLRVPPRPRAVDRQRPRAPCRPTG